MNVTFFVAWKVNNSPIQLNRERYENVYGKGQIIWDAASQYGSGCK